MEVKDIFLTPVYLIFIYLIALYFRPKVTNAYTRKYYLPALSLKLFGAVALGVVYYFYYRGGDTINYYEQSKLIYDSFWQSPILGLKILFSHGQFDPMTYAVTSKMRWYSSPTEFFVIRIAAVMSLFTFNTYSVIAMLFALLSFSGIWVMYNTFVRLYPIMYKQLAIAVFFVPSVFFWGSGLMKDSLCIGALGWLFYAFYTGLIEKKAPIKMSVIAVIAIYVLLSTKAYILFSFLAPAILWVFAENSRRIKNRVLRRVIGPLLVVGGVGAGIFGTLKLTEGDARYSLDNVAERAKITADYIYRVSIEQGGAAYSLGELDGTMGGMLKLAPQAVNVTLFRPYLWEVHNVIMLISSLESTIFLLFTLWIVMRTGLMRTLRIIVSSPLLTFSILFALGFSMSVGLSTNNFGSLARYKVHMMPFYLAVLYITNHIAVTTRVEKVQQFAKA